ncbi:MAG TPA: hypothetical protein VFJ21_12405 [Mycobacteriales bacterium]|jgi:uncharacterized integral membrane protein|nr:hypothetical protein [Mycobacteriales bacterium]
MTAPAVPPVHAGVVGGHGDVVALLVVLLILACTLLAVVLPGSVRILQLRRTARRHRRG